MSAFEPDNPYDEPDESGSGQGSGKAFVAGYVDDTGGQDDSETATGYGVAGDDAPNPLGEGFDSGSSQALLQGLKALYFSAVRPLEVLTRFDMFYSATTATAQTAADFEAAPIVLFLGPYSVGKTSFISFLLGRDFPGARIGPEPTTDGFVACMYHEADGAERTMPGNALSVAPASPFSGLTQFGNAFLGRFQGSLINSPVLRHITLIDTPGVLSGTEAQLQRGFDYKAVVRWFANRADLILLIFDPHKLDISGEMDRVIEAMDGSEDKVRVVLNKADMVPLPQLLKVYGALMWSLGKVLRTPEVAKIYLGSFWDQPRHYSSDEIDTVLQTDTDELLAEFRTLPTTTAIRRLNELVKRVRLLKVHAHLLDSIRAQMPVLFFKDNKKAEILAELPALFRKVMREHNLAPGDFPSIRNFKEVLQDQDFSEFPAIDKKLMDRLDDALSREIPALMDDPESHNMATEAKKTDEAASPWAFFTGTGASTGAGAAT